jgi:prepilin-type N-terminal cleavage/methylation domain-containing protein
VNLRQHQKRFGLAQSLERGFGGSRRSATHRRRKGFTILELLLASVAAAMLLSALYYSFDMTIQQTQVARDAAGTEDLTRGVVNRLAVDIGAILGPLPPSSGGTASIQASYTNAAATGATGVTATGATTTTTTGAGGGTSSSSSSANSTNTPLLGSGLNIPFEAGVIGGYEGQMTMLILFTSRVPDIFTSSGPNSLTQMYSQNTTGSTIQIPADLRRVVYWLGSNGGLYRQETPWVTGYSNGVSSWNLSDLPLSDDPSSLVAEEVKNVLFEFYDPYEETWEQTWDGTGGTQPPYSMLPGPPIAIRVTLTFEFANPRGGSPITSTVVQVFPVATAAGQIPALALYDPTSGGASSSGSSSSNVVGAKTTGAKTTGAMTTNGK